jgi:hypothetical protein
MVVFSSGKPTVTARLVCPDAAKAKWPTTTRAEALVRSFEVEVQHKQAARNIRAVCIRFVESNQERLRGRVR